MFGFSSCCCAAKHLVVGMYVQCSAAPTDTFLALGVSVAGKRLEQHRRSASWTMNSNRLDLKWQRNRGTRNLREFNVPVRVSRGSAARAPTFLFFTVSLAATSCCICFICRSPNAVVSTLPPTSQVQSARWRLYLC